MRLDLTASARELVWLAAQHDSGCYLTAAQTRALWDSILADTHEKLSAQDRADAAELLAENAMQHLAWLQDATEEEMELERDAS